MGSPVSNSKKDFLWQLGSYLGMIFVQNKQSSMQVHGLTLFAKGDDNMFLAKEKPREKWLADPVLNNASTLSQITNVVKSSGTWAMLLSRGRPAEQESHRTGRHPILEGSIAW